MNAFILKELRNQGILNNFSANKLLQEVGTFWLYSMVLPDVQQILHQLH